MKNSNMWAIDESTTVKVFLAYCPQSHPPTAPNPALAYLKGYLGETLPRTDITIKDLNAGYFHHLFSVPELERRFPTEKAKQIRAAYLAQQDEAAYRDVSSFIRHHKTLEALFELLP